MTEATADLLATFFRALHLAALALLFGTLLIGRATGPCQGRMAEGRMAAIAWAAALAGGGFWLAAQAALFAGAETTGAWLTAIDTVAEATRFGRTLLLRLLLLAPVGWMALRNRARAIALLLTGAAVALQPMLGHAGAAETPWPGVAGGLHVLAAAGWIGALPALLLALRMAHRANDNMGAARLARRFSPLGGLAVLILCGSGLVLAVNLVGSVPSLLGTPYGRFLLAKLVLLAAMLALAAWNRFRLTPRLADGKCRAIVASILAETGLGAAAIALAATMAREIPGAHAQPDWPFPWRPSLAALTEPELRSELAAASLGLCIALTVATVLFVRFRRPLAAPMVLLAGLAWAAPSARLLLVTAWPTSYWQAPAATPEAVALGAALYQRDCVMCHGAEGRGDGPAARGQPVSPADLTAAHLLDHSDGELFWWIAHGMQDPRGALVMPAHPALSEEEVWALIEYIRAANPYAALARPNPPRHGKH